FDQINQSDLDAITKEITANFAHSTVTGASSLGDVWGVELSLIGGMTKTPEIERRVKEVDPQTTVSSLPDVVLAAQVSVPYGITGELAFFPAVGSESFRFSNLGLGVKWTLTQGLLELPLDIAVKVNYTTTNLSFTQTINNASTGNVPVDSKVESKTNTLGYGVFVSKELALIEPYAGLTFLNAKSDLSVSGTGTIFDTTYTNGQSGSSSPSGTMFTLGVDLSLAIIKIGAEFNSVLGTQRYLGKLALSF
ncbi:MAG TPA: DUF6588 family protein, partial [Bdellovibrionales bacterium]|nr:DUF6588 family protein [Bdellovibrionales bacterium]